MHNVPIAEVTPLMQTIRRRAAAATLSFAAVLMAAAPCSTIAAQDVSTRIDLVVVTDEATAVLDVLDKRAAGTALSNADWAKIFASEGYVRLGRRERGMGRAWSDSAFRAFALTDTLLGRRIALERTLSAWSVADPRAAATRALAYLPAGTRIRARVYPVIKPQDNSFVFFEEDAPPAIFLYIDPAVSAARYENTLAHELHHIGVNAGCTDPVIADTARALAVRWLGAFAEGVAMLAAAGGPGTHPHAVSPPEERARWDRDVQNYATDMVQLERFFDDILDGRLRGNDLTSRGMAFFGVQGPWYTVGWQMASTVERVFGRQRVVDSQCDMRLLLQAWNEAAQTLEARGEQLPRWSTAFLQKLTG
jgi:hypothetical protein